jgi:hypothetical protein
MRLPCVRFTLRRMMVGVAVVAGVIWGSQTAASLWLAQYHAFHETSLRTEWAEDLAYKRNHGEYQSHFCGVFQTAMMLGCERAEWHGQLKLKYQRAVFQPWLLVEPDPPEPQYLSWFLVEPDPPEPR